MNKPKDFTPPSFAPYAQATNRGWVNPKDGSLLVPNSGLLNRMEAWKALNPPKPNEAPEEIPEPVIFKIEQDMDDKDIDAGIEVPQLSMKTKKKIKPKKEA